MTSVPHEYRAVTVNVGLSSVYSHNADRERVMLAWAERAQKLAPDLVFAQECSEAWLAGWAAEDYDIVRWDTSAPIYGPKSALLGRRDRITLSALGKEAVPTLAYHGSYVAAACWESHPQKPVLLSVHASPNKVEDRYLRHWPPDVDTPVGRFGRKGRATPTRPWDSEMVLSTIGHVAAAGHSVLAAGDLNEARGWDHLPLHQDETWGSEFFACLNGPDLYDALHPRWDRKERMTHWNEKEQRALQLDHVFGTKAMADSVLDPQVDGDWDESARCQEAHGSDHAPVWFVVRVHPRRRRTDGS